MLEEIKCAKINADKQLEFCSVNLKNSEEGTIFFIYFFFIFTIVYYLGTKNCYTETGAPVWQLQRFTNKHGVSRPLRVLSGIVSRYLPLTFVFFRQSSLKDVPGQTRTGQPVVPLSRDKKIFIRGPFVPGQKKKIK